MSEIIKIKCLTPYEELGMFDVMWSLTTWCNYKCSYCFQQPHTNFMKPINEILYEASRINEIILDYKKTNVRLSLLGGEITYYDLIKVLEKFTCNLTRVVLVTNFSQRFEYFTRLYEYCKNRNIHLQLMCSYHEVGDEFFEKYIKLVKWCLDNDQPFPYVSFVLDNDFDFTIFERFKDLPHSLTHFNVKQSVNNSCLFPLNEETKLKWKNIVDDKFKWSNNRLIKPFLERRKENAKSIWWLTDERGYEVTYNNNDKRFLHNLKEVMMENPSILNGPVRYCTAINRNLFIEEDGNLYSCSTNVLTPLGNIKNYKTKNYHTINDFTCEVKNCALCHEVNIYKNLKDLLTDENNLNLKEDN